MKSVISLVFLLTVFVTLSFAAVSIGIYNDPANPGKCTISKDLILSSGEIAKNPNDECSQIICGSDGFAEFQSCGAEAVEDGCKLADYDVSIPYPDCCKRDVICE